MILYIEKELITRREEILEEISKILEEFNISYISYTDEIHITKQKVTLDEKDMNYLFSDVLIYFQFSIVYGGYGGYGCDFSLEIY